MPIINYSRNWLISFLLCFLFLTSNAQQDEIDSLRKELLSYESRDTSYINVLNKLANTISQLDNDSSFLLSTASLRLSKSLDYQGGMAAAYRNLGILYIPRSRYDTSLMYLDSSLVILRDHQDISLESAVHNGFGVAYEESANFQKALDHYFHSIRLKEKIDDHAGVGKIHSNIGKAYFSLGVYDSATSYLVRALENEAYIREYNKGGLAILNLGSVKLSIGELEEAKRLFHEALRIEEEVNEPVPIGTLNGWLGYVSLLQQDLDSAMYYFQYSLGIFQRLNHIKGASAIIARVAGVYMARQQYDSALIYLQSGLTAKNEIHDSQNVPELLLDMARCYDQLGIEDLALSYAIRADNLAERINSKSESLMSTEFIHRLYKARGEYDKAYGVLIKHLAYKDSVLNEQKLAEIKRLETVYGVSRLEADKQQLEQASLAQELIYASDLRRRNIINYSISGGLFLMLLLAGNYYLSLKRKQRANQLLEEKNEKITLQATELKVVNEKIEELSQFKEGLTFMIAHDMKNSLNNILGLSSTEPFDEKMHSIGASGRLMLNLVTNMLDVQKFEETEVPLNRANHELKDLVAEARSQIELLLKMKSLRFLPQVDEGLVVNADAEVMIRILVNLLTNAIKYSRSGTTIQLSSQPSSKENSSFIDVSVKDNGVGIDPDKLPHIFEKYWQQNAKYSGASASTGIGLTFCKLAIEAHGGKIWAESIAGDGTTINLSVPSIEKPKGKFGQFSDESGMDTLVLPNEKKIVQGFAIQMRNHEVYQVGQLKALLEEMDKNEIHSQWKLDVKAAIFEGDKEKFEELVNTPELTTEVP